MKILETERLLLRGLEQGDFKDVCKLLQDDEVMYAYEGAFNDQEVQNWLDRQFGRYRHDGFGLWGVVEKGSNELIGQCGITYQEFDGKRYNPQIQISAESETKRSIFREKDKTKRSKKESAQHSKSRNKSFVMTSVSAL